MSETEQGAFIFDVAAAVISTLAPFAKTAQVDTGTSGAAKIVEEVPATTPVGRKGKPLVVPKGTNSTTSIGGRQFSGHALVRMQRQGIVPTVVENVI